MGIGVVVSAVLSMGWISTEHALESERPESLLSLDHPRCRCRSQTTVLVRLRISPSRSGYDIWLTDCGIISFRIESSLEFESRGTTNCTMKVPPPRSRPTNEQKSLGDGPFLGSYSNFCERQIQNLRQRPRSVQLTHDQHRVLLVKTP